MKCIAVFDLIIRLRENCKCLLSLLSQIVFDLKSELLRENFKFSRMWFACIFQSPHILFGV